MAEKIYAGENETQFFNHTKQLYGDDWDEFKRKRSAYYVLPQWYNQTEFFWMNNVESQRNLKSLQQCALSLPYISYLSLNSSYTHSQSWEAYIGFETTGVLCTWTQDAQSVFHSKMKPEDYFCPAANVTEYLRDVWDEKWYSVLCRGWFKG